MQAGIEQESLYVYKEARVRPARDLHELASRRACSRMRQLEETLLRISRQRDAIWQDSYAAVHGRRTCLSVMVEANARTNAILREVST